MTKIIVDNQEYDTEELSKEVMDQVNALQHTNNEIVRLQLQLAAIQTANNVYVSALRDLLKKEGKKNKEQTEEKPSYDDNGALNFDNL